MGYEMQGMSRIRSKLEMKEFKKLKKELVDAIYRLRVDMCIGVTVCFLLMILYDIILTFF